MTKPLGQIPLVKSYGETLQRLILSPAEIGESALFIWPDGNAKSFHLPAVVVNRPESIYIDFLPDLAGTYPSFLEIFYKRVNLKQKTLLVLNQLDSYPEKEFALIVNFLTRLPAAAPGKFLFSIHLRNSERIKFFLEICKESVICSRIIKIPLPSEEEAKEIIKETAKISGLDLTTEHINKIFLLTGPVISSIRAVLRSILENSERLKHIPSIAAQPNFKLRFPDKQTVAMKETKTEFNLTDSEYKIYLQLTGESDGFLSRDEIATIIWGDKSYEKFSDWAINKTISRLRQKIFAATKTDTIKNIKGKGYKYVED